MTRRIVPTADQAENILPVLVGQAVPGSNVRIELIRLGEIRKWPNNPKMHDQPGILASMNRFGFVAPILYDETAGQLVAGHGRTEALAKLKGDGLPPPDRIQVAPD